jgi:hypothetical protein
VNGNHSEYFVRDKNSLSPTTFTYTFSDGLSSLLGMAELTETPSKMDRVTSNFYSMRIDGGKVPSQNRAARQIPSAYFIRG